MQNEVRGSRWVSSLLICCVPLITNVIHHYRGGFIGGSQNPTSHIFLPKKSQIPHIFGQKIPHPTFILSKNPSPTSLKTDIPHFWGLKIPHPTFFRPKNPTSHFSINPPLMSFHLNRHMALIHKDIWSCQVF